MLALAGLAGGESESESETETETETETESDDPPARELRESRYGEHGLARYPFTPYAATRVILTRSRGQSDYAAITDICIFNSNSIELT